MSKHRSIRFDDSTLARLEAVAKEFSMEWSAAVRWMVKRGLAATESEREGSASPKRRVLSRGVE